MKWPMKFSKDLIIKPSAHFLGEGGNPGQCAAEVRERLYRVKGHLMFHFKAPVSDAK